MMKMKMEKKMLTCEDVQYQQPKPLDEFITPAKTEKEVEREEREGGTREGVDEKIVENEVTASLNYDHCA